MTFPADDHRTFLRFAAAFEAGLAAVGIGLAWLASIRPPALMPDARAFAVGVAGTVPLVLFYLAASRLRLRPLRRIHDLLLATLGGPLARCRWYDLVLLATLAGVCEEVLFRGVLQPWIGRLGAPVGLVAANLLFGLAHAVTPTYAVLAAGIGFYLSGVQAVAGGNLAAPMLTHGLYDLFAFAMIAREYRRRGADEGDSPEDAAGPPVPKRPSDNDGGPDSPEPA